ncbi:MAG: sensor histidine kinase [Nocardioides sp.]
MRERLAAAFALVAVLVIGAFTLARAYSLDTMVTGSESAEVTASTRWFAAVVEQRRQAGDPVDGAFLHHLVDGPERLVYVGPDGTTVTAAGTAFRADDPVRDLVASRHLPGGGTVELSRSGADVEADVARSLLPLVALGLVLVVVAAGLGYLAARMLARPFQELAGHARALGRGRFDLAVPRYAVPEADTVGQALQTSAGQLRTLLLRERRFAADASHDLRTPMTAMRLELEDLTLDPQLPPAAAEQVTRALAELERLSGTVDHLLERTRDGRIGAYDVDVAELAADAVRRAVAGAPADREVRADAPGPALVRMPPGPIEQVIDALLDDALRHGRGTVTVEVRDAGDHVHLRVRDEGDPARERPAVRSLEETASALGARVSAEPGPVAALAVRLPRS